MCAGYVAVNGVSCPPHRVMSVSVSVVCAFETISFIYHVIKYHDVVADGVVGGLVVVGIDGVKVLVCFCAFPLAEVVPCNTSLPLPSLPLP